MHPFLFGAVEVSLESAEILHDEAGDDRIQFKTVLPVVAKVSFFRQRTDTHEKHKRYKITHGTLT